MACSAENFSCTLPPSVVGEKDAVAGVRMMVSLLSIMGSSAIIASLIRRRLVWRPTMHPIFQLSIADWILGVLWVVGACIWFRGASDRVWCFAVSFLTVVLECVTANLTLVYAILAYSFLKKNSTRSALDRVHSPSQIWHPMKSALVYLTAWILPVVIVGIMFTSLTASSNLVKDANECSCWCFPHIGNILPYSLAKDLPSAMYLFHVRKLLVAYSVVLLLNFLTVFILIAVLYWKILKEIKTIKKRVAALGSDVVNVAVRSSQSKARRRTIFFLLAFLATASSTVILCVMGLIREGGLLRGGIKIDDGNDVILHSKSGQSFYYFVHLFQSVTVPLQGFLNAIVYGRTREDFVQMMGSTGRFFNTEGDGSTVHVIRYSSEYSEEEKSEISALSIEEKSDADCPSPLLDSGN